MLSEKNYDQKFQLARSAYIEGDLEQASNILEEMFQENPEDPNVLLLRGHINFSHNEYDIAKNNYQKVLDLTEQEELVELAHDSLKKIENELLEKDHHDNDDNEELFSLESLEDMEELDFSGELGNSSDGDDEESSDEGWTESIQFDNIEWDDDDLQEQLEDITDNSLQPQKLVTEENSFNFDEEANDISSSVIHSGLNTSAEMADFIDTDNEDSILNDFDTRGELADFIDTDNEDSILNDFDTRGELAGFINTDNEDSILNDFDTSTFNYRHVDELEEDDIEDQGDPTFAVTSEGEQKSGSQDLEQILTDDNQLFHNADDDYSSALQPLDSNAISEESPFEEDEPFVPQGENDFFTVPDDLDDIPDIDVGEIPASIIFTKETHPEHFMKETQPESFTEETNADIFTKETNADIFTLETKTEENDTDINQENILDIQENVFDSDFDDSSDISSSFRFDTGKINSLDDEDISTSSDASEPSLMNTGLDITPEVEIPQDKITSRYYNGSLLYKQILHGGITAIVTCIAVILVGVFSGGEKIKTDENTGNPASEAATEEIIEAQAIAPVWLLGLIGGTAGGLSSVGLGMFLNSYIKRYLNEFSNQFDSIYQGNYNVKVTVGSQDEFGSLAASFNQMSKMIKTTTKEAKKRAEETEKAREDLQRQVIRLLDDVEGAARGDLTVQAEVTADVLGAVADAFNLTINSLRKIVKQVQEAAIQVNKASADSELYARNQSSDALRMAEELAVTLNSVQMMSDSIQRVAENAKEAEEVARSSSVTALKGGDAVERTVAGILQIRETVSETTRKVKRLAEASQQISTIVAVISQISSRTNLLALNASIQAARAGEAGRGFAIVADEVRQLADRSAKSLQEIEQIVLQIQTETGSVMTAMEEGIQQVKDVTERSEQAKRSLEDIIQVSNRIDTLVRSITADTDEQRENSREVAKVMQDVELTAQATSQESQRVAGSLQNVVGIGKDLISSVKRFKVD